MSSEVEKKRERNFEEKKSKRKKKNHYASEQRRTTTEENGKKFRTEAARLKLKLGGNGWVIYDRFPQHAHAFFSLFRRSAVYCRVKFQNPAYIIAKGGSNVEKLLKYWTCVKRRIWNVNFFMLRFALAFSLSLRLLSFFYFIFRSRALAHIVLSLHQAYVVLLLNCVVISLLMAYGVLRFFFIFNFFSGFFRCTNPFNRFILLSTGFGSFFRVRLKLLFFIRESHSLLRFLCEFCVVTDLLSSLRFITLSSPSIMHLVHLYPDGQAE